jgi:uncharacterized protein YjeT (DUF2065 family)
VTAWGLLVSALALMLVFEGFLPFVSPTAWRRWFEQVLQLSDGQLRFIGLSCMLAGALMLLVLWR